MRPALESALTFDIPVADHCEEPTLAAGGAMHEGLVATRLGLKGIPAAAEEIMVARDILLAELTGGRVHLCHLSTRGAGELMRRAQERGPRGTAGGAPPHPRLPEAARESYDTHPKMNPPPPTPPTPTTRRRRRATTPPSGSWDSRRRSAGRTRSSCRAGR